MNIYSWNVNGIRAAHRKGFGRWLNKSNADVVAVQEVRAHAEDIPRSLVKPKGWHTHFSSAQRRGYSGVGLFSREPFESVHTSLEHEAFDAEGRIQIARRGKLTIVNGYFPNGNGKDRDLSRIPFKLKFYRHLFKTLTRMADAGERVLVMGDFNTAHEERDLARPRENRENSGFRPEERREFARWLSAGWVDTFRHFEPAGGHYTWWSQRVGVRKKNIGWRIDYVLASPGAMPFVLEAQIHPRVLGSDHCPISVRMNPAVVGSPD